MVVTILKLQREDLVVECQMKGKATRSAPYPQCHHSLGTLGSPYDVLMDAEKKMDCPRCPEESRVVYSSFYFQPDEITINISHRHCTACFCVVFQSVMVRRWSLSS